MLIRIRTINDVHPDLDIPVTRKKGELLPENVEPMQSKHDPVVVLEYGGLTQRSSPLATEHESLLDCDNNIAAFDLLPPLSTLFWIGNR